VPLSMTMAGCCARARLTSCTHHINSGVARHLVAAVRRTRSEPWLGTSGQGSSAAIRAAATPHRRHTRSVDVATHSIATVSTKCHRQQPPGSHGETTGRRRQHRGHPPLQRFAQEMLPRLATSPLRGAASAASLLGRPSVRFYGRGDLPVNIVRACVCVPMCRPPLPPPLPPAALRLPPSAAPAVHNPSPAVNGSSHAPTFHAVQRVGHAAASSQHVHALQRCFRRRRRRRRCRITVAATSLSSRPFGRHHDSLIAATRVACVSWRAARGPRSFCVLRGSALSGHLARL
jgi:hypothetical protein